MLLPAEPHAAARVDQWIAAADAYFIPHARVLVIEGLFRRYLGGEQDRQAMGQARDGVQPTLDVLDRALAESEYIAGASFSLADIHWMPYFEYLTRIGEAASITRRERIAAWWTRVSARPTWQKVARTGPQPYEEGTRADVIEKLHRR